MQSREIKMNKQKIKKGFTLVEAITILTIVLVLALVLGVPSCKALGGANIEYSEGSRTGVVYKISKKGLIWDTWEGELSLQLTARDSEGQLVNEKFKFSVSDPEVAKQVVAASESGEAVTLKYKQYILRGYRYGGRSYDVTGVSVKSPAEK